MFLISRRRLVQSAGGRRPCCVASPVGRGCFLGARCVQPAQDAATVTFWTPGGSPTYCEVHTEIAADYKAVNPNVTVNFQCGTDPDAFTERLLGAIAAGNPPDATVYWDTPVSLGVRGALLPLDDLMADAEYATVENWPAGVLASCQFGGQTWGLPVAAGHLRHLVQPGTVRVERHPQRSRQLPQDMGRAARALEGVHPWDGDRLVTAGFVLPTPSNFAPTLPIWSALNGGQLYDAANQRYTIDAEPNVAMMDYFVAWLDEEYKGDFNMVDRSGAWERLPERRGPAAAVPGGQPGDVEWGSWGLGDFYAYGEPAFERWNVRPTRSDPSGETAVSGYWPNWLVIPQNARQPEAAFDYLDYMSGVGVVKWFEVIPDLPTNAKVPETVPTWSSRSAARSSPRRRSWPSSGISSTSSPRCGTRRCRDSPTTSSRWLSSAS